MEKRIKKPGEPSRRYSISHVQKRFKEIYALDVVKIWGYKMNRYSCIRYNVFDSDGNLVLGRVTLKALAEHLISKGEY